MAVSASPPSTSWRPHWSSSGIVALDAFEEGDAELPGCLGGPYTGCGWTVPAGVGALGSGATLGSPASATSSRSLPRSTLASAAASSRSRALLAEVLHWRACKAGAGCCKGAGDDLDAWVARVRAGGGVVPPQEPAEEPTPPPPTAEPPPLGGKAVQEYSEEERKALDAWIRTTVDPRRKIVWWSPEQPKPVGDPFERGNSRATGASASGSRRGPCRTASGHGSTMKEDGCDDDNGKWHPLRVDYELLRVRERANRLQYRQGRRRCSPTVPSASESDSAVPRSKCRPQDAWSSEPEDACTSEAVAAKDATSVTADWDAAAKAVQAAVQAVAEKVKGHSSRTPGSSASCASTEASVASPEGGRPGRCSNPDAPVCAEGADGRTADEAHGSCSLGSCSARGTPKPRSFGPPSEEELNVAAANLERLDAAADGYALNLCRALLGEKAGEAAAELEASTAALELIALASPSRPGAQQHTDGGRRHVDPVLSPQSAAAASAAELDEVTTTSPSPKLPCASARTMSQSASTAASKEPDEATPTRIKQANDGEVYTPFSNSEASPRREQSCGCDNAPGRGPAADTGKAIVSSAEQLAQELRAANSQLAIVEEEREALKKRLAEALRQAPTPSSIAGSPRQSQTVPLSPVSSKGGRSSSTANSRVSRLTRNFSFNWLSWPLRGSGRRNASG